MANGLAMPQCMCADPILGLGSSGVQDPNEGGENFLGSSNLSRLHERKVQGYTTPGTIKKGDREPKECPMISDKIKIKWNKNVKNKCIINITYIISLL